MSIKRLTFLLTVFMMGYLAPAVVLAQETHKARVEYRSPSEDKMEKYLAGDDFKYERPKAPSTFEPWEKFKAALADLMKRIFGNAPSSESMLNFLYILASLIIIWVVVKLVGVDLNTAFKKSREVRPVNYHINEENIQNIDFEKEMGTARESGQWRLLIRLQYLFALKKLADKNLVEIRAGKTNHDYLYEMRDQDLKPLMLSLSRIFEYTWYGHFEVGPATLAEADRQFTDLKNRLGR